jgi:phosphoglycolate phosphatase
VTSNSVSSVEAVLTHEGLLPFFDRIHSEPSVFGKARTLSKMIRKYAVEPGTAWYVGDEVRDVEAAHEAGLQSVAVSW